MEALEVRRVQHSEDLAKPGEYVFVGKRQPNITIEKKPLTPPTGFWSYLWWTWFGKRYEIKQIVEVLWPEYDAIIVNCPHCYEPLVTAKEQTIEWLIANLRNADLGDPDFLMCDRRTWWNVADQHIAVRNVQGPTREIHHYITEPPQLQGGIFFHVEQRDENITGAKAPANRHPARHLTPQPRLRS